MLLLKFIEKLQFGRPRRKRQETEPFATFPAQANCRRAEGSVFSGTF
jgi:hypothetical protein